MTNNKEIWADAYEFEDNYMVSNLGNIKSKRTNNLLAKTITRGYYYVSLHKTIDGKAIRKNLRFGRLILKSFDSNQEDKQVNHKNLNPLDDRLENLEWCTHSENIIHSYSFGKRKPSGKIIHSLEIVEAMRKLRENGYMLKDISSKFNIPISTITHILLGTRRTTQR